MRAFSVPLLVILTAAPLMAASYRYNISGVVTDTPNVPNVFPEGPQWDFSGGNAFSGSFVADGSVSGPISDFELIIGGIDVLAFHPESTFEVAGGGMEELNFFDPTSLALRWAGIDTEFFTTFVSIGETVPGIPGDRIVALQFTDPLILPPGDPVFLSTINWEGTFAVTKGKQVPESGSTFAVASLGFGGLLLLNALSGRKKRA